MTFQPWIPMYQADLRDADMRFQWGHDFSAMDTWLRPVGLRASARRFNGAMTFQPWIPVVDRDGLPYRTGVSMGP